MFERDCPTYLALGMTWEQYWYGPAWMVEAFSQADRLRQRRQNELAWLHGLYIYDAVGCVVSNALSKKGAKTARYPDKPYALAGDEERKKADEKEERQKAFAFFNKFAKRKKPEAESGVSGNG